MREWNRSAAYSGALGWFWTLAAFVGVGLAIGYMGPLRTGELEPARRYGFWIAQSLIWGLQLTGGLALLRDLPALQRLEPVLLGVLAGAGFAMPTAFEVLGLTHFLLDWPFPGRAGILGQCAAASLACVAGGAVIAVGLFPVEPKARVAEPEAENPAASGTQPEPAPTAAFLARLPPELGNGLIALRMEDHYLRVYTLKGEGLILCRFGDALRELAGFPGMQVHRSWYVAIGAVVGTQADGPRVFLTLANGLVVPVSRSYHRAAREIRTQRALTAQTA